LGRAIVEAAASRGMALEDVRDFSAMTGPGCARARGRPRGGGGQTRRTVTVDGAAAGEIEIADTIKPEAAAAIARLRAMGLEVWMITGDQPSHGRTPWRAKPASSTCWPR
jgi:Cu+-exporting ATPase